MMHDHDRTASGTLDSIRSGGQQLITIVKLRMAEAEEALSQGYFQNAHARLAEAQQMIAPLSAAEAYMAIADDSYVVRVSEMEAGMHIVNVGVIEEIEKAACLEHGQHVTVKINGQEMNFDPDAQLYVRRDAPQPA